MHRKSVHLLNKRFVIMAVVTTFTFIDSSTLSVSDATLTPSSYAPRTANQVRSIAIGSSAIAISNSFLFQATALTAVTVTNATNLRSIGNSAFEGCTALGAILLSSSQLTSIGTAAFKSCSALSNVTLPNMWLRSIGAECFRGSRIQSFQAPFGLSEIPTSCFQNCTSLAFLSIPTVTSIGVSAMEGCTNLLNFSTVDSPLSTIGDRAFFGCAIRSLSLPQLVNSIGNECFRNCSAITRIQLINQYQLSNVGTNAVLGIGGAVTTVFLDFHQTAAAANLSAGAVNLMAQVQAQKLVTPTYIPPVTSLFFGSLLYTVNTTTITRSTVTALGTIGTLSSIFVGQNVTSIEGLNDAPLLSSITFRGQSTCTSIGDSCFQNCTSMLSVALPPSVSNIGSGAFRGTALVTLRFLSSNTWPSQLTTIGQEAFANTNVFNMMDLPTSVTSLGESCFALCNFPLFNFTPPLPTVPASLLNGVRSLLEVTLNAAVQTIGASAFQGTPLTSVIFLGNNVNTISSNALRSCTALKSFVVPNTVTSLGSAVFRDCTTLTSLTLPSSLTALSNELVRGCAALPIIIVPSGVLSIGADCFNGCSLISALNLPTTLTLIGAGAFASCTSLASLAVPALVSNIGASTFSSCTALTLLTFDSAGTLTALGSSALANCSAITMLQFPPLLSTISDSAFNNMTRLTQIVFSNQRNFRGTVGTNITTGIASVSNQLNVVYGYTSAERFLTPSSQTLQAQFPTSNPTTTYTYMGGPVCFGEGTLLLGPNDEYLAIEKLRVGDQIQTYKHGLRRIRRIGHGILCTEPGNTSNCMYVMKRTENNGLTADLMLTGGHGILVDDITDGVALRRNRQLFKGELVKIDDKVIQAVCTCKAFKAINDYDRTFTYYQLALEGENGDDHARFGVYANGLLVETPSFHQLQDVTFLSDAC